MSWLKVTLGDVYAIIVTPSGRPPPVAFIPIAGVPVIFFKATWFGAVYVFTNPLATS